MVCCNLVMRADLVSSYIPVTQTCATGLVVKVWNAPLTNSIFCP